MKIYSPPDNHKLAKIVFTAHIFGIPLTHEPIPYSHKNKQFQEQHALFSIPALETQTCNFVFGVNSILRALSTKQTPSSAFQQAEINQWLELVERQFETSVGVLILKANDLAEVKQQQLIKAKESVVKVMKLVDQRLKTNTFLVADKLSIADISVYFSWNEVRTLLQKQTKNFSNVMRWSKHIAFIPNQ